MLRSLISTSIFILLLSNISFGVSTSWKGTGDDDWKDAANWTNGVPSPTVDAIIGDASFTGSKQPSIKNGKGQGECFNLTIGNSTKVSILTIKDKLDIYGNITIGANGTFDQDQINITVAGNWTNSGSYLPKNQNSRIYFTGVNQTIGGSVATDFQKLYINATSTTTLAQNVIISNNIDVSGTLDPATFQFTGSGDIDVNSGATLKVKAATFGANYAVSVNTIAGSIIEYASTSLNQSVSNTQSYKTLKISGATTKTLLGNTTVTTDLNISSGTLDLVGFTTNGTGTINIAGGATLKIGATNTFPSTYTTKILATTSTVEYYGGNQTVAAVDYGNLIMSSSSGTIVKTMPAGVLTINGSLTTSASAGTLSFTALNNINVNTNITLGSLSTFNGGSSTHSLSGNWTNNGTYNGCSAILRFNGSNTTIGGTGTNNFGDMVVTGSGTTLSANTSLTLCGNFSTTGGGSFTHTNGGTGIITMTGASKSISGSNITFAKLTISNTATISTTGTFTIANNFVANGNFTASSGTITYSGTSSISGSAVIQLAAVTFAGTITTARDLLISSNVVSSGSFTASAGLVTFNGSSTLSGTLNLFNVSILTTKTLTMGSSSVLGIAGAVTFPAGAIFNPTSNVPNTVNYNGSGAQALVFTTFNNLTMSGGNTKTPPSGLTVNGNLTIGASTTFNGSTFTHGIKGNWTNSGTFSASTSTIEFNGTNDANITGVTSFNNLTVNKSATNKVNLINNCNVVNLAMTSGGMLTGSNAITITATRTGNGTIIGTITRTHAFATSTNYAFEGPDNYINFSSITGSITSITTVVALGANATFPGAASVNRTYNMSVTGSSTYTADLRLHYEDSEINGNVENAMTMWNDGGTGTWTDFNKSSNDATSNWVSKTGLTSLINKWTISEGLIKYTWNGSAGTSWSNGNNWTPVGVPTIADVAHIGDIVFTNHPTISTVESVKKVYFNSTTASTLTFAAGSNLTVKGNIDGIWTSNAIHTLNIGAQTLTTQSDIVMSDGVANRRIDINISTGTLNIDGSFTQKGAANFICSGAAIINLKGNYSYIDGTFTPSTSTFNFIGTGLQTVGGVTYYNLNMNKVSGQSLINSTTTVNNNLTLSTGGITDISSTLNVLGNINIGAGATLHVPSNNAINIGGNWIKSGTFTSGSGTVTFNGSGAQTVESTTFNNITVNKPAGTLTILGDLTLNGDIDIQAGTVEVLTFNVNRSSLGGSATLAAGTFVLFGGSGLQINNFASLNANATSTIEFYTSSARIIPPITYGNLVITNGGTNAKTMVGPTSVLGDLTVNSNSTLVAPSSTLTLGGNFTMNGTFNANSGTVLLNGVTKTIAGMITYNNMVANGSYTFTSGSITLDGYITVNSGGDFNSGNLPVISHGDFTNSGSVFSSGTVTFTGLQTQNISLLTAISSTSTGVINFNGTVSPVLNSTSAPSFATVNINNTAPIIASQPWTVGVAINIANGATWVGGSLNHVFYRNFINNGTVTSSGKLSFYTLTTGTVNLGTNFTTTGTVDFSGPGVITLVDNNPTFNNLTISNTNAAGVLPSTNWIISHDVLINNSSLLKGGALNHTVSGKWTNNGTYEGQTSTVTFNTTNNTDAITGTGTNNFYNIIFSTGNRMDVVSNVNISKDFTNNSDSLEFISQLVKFNGSGISILGGSSLSTFNNLEISKSSNYVQLSRSATISGSLILTSGYLDLNTTNLNITNPLSTSVSRTGGYVLSESTSFSSSITWQVGTDLTVHEFPFGSTAGDYIPFSFDLNSGDAGSVTVATYGTGNDNLPLPPTVTNIKDSIGGNNSANTVDRFFHIGLSDSTNPIVDVTFRASISEVGGIASLRAQRWNGNKWEAPLTGQTAGATSVTVPGVSQFSPWAISGNNVPLPISLLFFDAKNKDGGIVFNWATATEIDNDYFEIEHSRDGVHFSPIKKVSGAGTSFSKISYQEFAFSPVNEINYYRLKQVDYDGQFSYSSIVVLDNNKSSLNYYIYPNPTTEFINVLANYKFTNEVNVSMFDAKGMLVLNKRYSKDNANKEIKIQTHHLPKGIYSLDINDGERVETQKIIVE